MPRAPQKVANTIARLSETFGDKRLASITLRDLEQYKTKRLEHVKIATVNRELFLLRAMLNTAVRRKYIEVSPFVYAQPGQPIDVEAEDSRDITVATFVQDKRIEVTGQAISFNLALNRVVKSSYCTFQLNLSEADRHERSHRES